jgi:flagellar biosynthesis protein FlhA
MLSPHLEQLLLNALQQTDQGLAIVLETATAQRLLQRLAQAMERMAASGHQPVLLCTARLRLPLRRFTERALPNLVVLSYAEIAPQVTVQSSGVVSLDEG